MHAPTTSRDATTFQSSDAHIRVKRLLIETFNVTSLEAYLATVLVEDERWAGCAVVVDMRLHAHLPPPELFDALAASLRARGLTPLGVVNATSKQLANAAKAGWVLLQSSCFVETPCAEASGEVNTQVPDEPLAAQATSSQDGSTRVVERPIRSGQQVVVRGGDLVVFGSVSHGAEVIADGNITVHGALRGKAIAGASGREDTYIYCQALEGELVSVAGRYAMMDAVPADLQQPGRACRVTVDGDTLKFQALGA